MPSFSKRSRSMLGSCHSELQLLCYDVITHFDFTVLEGHRSNRAQDELFAQGKTTLKGGQSKHNSLPSLAVDLAPYPIDWDDKRRFFVLAGMMFQAAAERQIKLRWGGDWDGDWDMNDQSFIDLPHFELLGD